MYSHSHSHSHSHANTSCAHDQRAGLNFRGASWGVTRAIQALRGRFDQFISPFIPAHGPVLYVDPAYHANFGDNLIAMGTLRLLHRFANEVVMCLSLIHI